MMRLLHLLKSIALFLFFFSSTLHATDITLDASAKAKGVSISSLSWQHKASGSERLLAVSIVVGSSRTINSLTFNGIPLTEASSTFTNSMTVALWYLVNPPSGVGTVEVTISGAADILCGSHSYNGVNQLTPFRNVVAQTGNSSNGSSTIASNPDDLVIDAVGFINEEPQAGPEQKEIFLHQGSLNSGSSLKAGATTVQMSWLHNTDEWGIVIGSLQSVTALPIELLDFHATTEHYKVRLDWITASESNNSHFQVEKSADGSQWHMIKEVPGAGNSYDYRSYSIYDEEPFAGTSYYRLRQIDFDGQFELMEPISVELKALAVPVQVFPNPVRQSQEMSLLYKYAGEDAEVEIRISDLTGRRIITQYFEASALASPIYRISLEAIQQGGFYIVQLYDANSHRLEQRKVFISMED